MERTLRKRGTVSFLSTKTIKKPRKCSIKTAKSRTPFERPNKQRDNTDFGSIHETDIPEVGMMEIKEGIPPKMREELNVIQKRKNQLNQLSKERKIILATMYSECSNCVHSCFMWIGIQPIDANYPCDNCHHPFTQHSVEVLDMSENDLNQFLNLASDIESLQTALHKESDPNKKTAYYYAINVLLKCRNNLKRPNLKRPLFGPMPFETPNVIQIMHNFTLCYYGRCPPTLWKNISNIASVVLRLIKYSNYDLPTRFLRKMSSEAETRREADYFRWIVLSHIPQYCNSLRYYDPLILFGRNFLLSIFPSISAQLRMEITNSKIELSEEMQNVICNGVNPFLDAFEMVVNDDTSPIWDPHYKYQPTEEAGDMEQVLNNTQPSEMNEYLRILANIKGSCRRIKLLRKTLRVPRAIHTFYKIDANDIPVMKTENPLFVDTFTPLTIRKILRMIPDKAINKRKFNNNILAGSSEDELLHIRGGDRDYFAKMEQECGKSQVYVVGCTGGIASRKTLYFMNHLLEIFARQLPLMPRPYICRILFDRAHKTLTLVKNNTPVAGICFRTFEEWGFAEVVFCAVTASEQVKGYGTYVMNNLKDYLISKGIKDILTYADSTAIGYFEKQGYSKSLLLPEATYKNALKYYNSATLMHCSLYQRFPYMQFTALMNISLAVVNHVLGYRDESPSYLSDFTRTLSHLGAVHAGPRYFPMKRLLSLDKLPQLRDAPLPTKKIVSANFRELNESLKFIFGCLESSKYATPFFASRNKNKDSNSAKNSFCNLTMVAERLKNHYYVDLSLFKGDVLRIINNAYRCNTPKSKIYKCAKELELIFYNSLKKARLICCL